MMMEFFANAIKQRKEELLYRNPVNSDAISSTKIIRENSKLISFCSNDYLGLAHNKKVKKAAIKTIKKFGVGASSSRYISGNNSLYQKLESEISRWKNCSDAIVFSSGYATAIGIIPAIVSKGDLIISDRLIHSSLIDGSILSQSRMMRFKHNNIEHCREILEENREKYEKCLIITETVFSMDGDLGKIDELLKLAKKFDCLLLSDDAHGIGIKKLPSHKNHLQMGTLSKSIGAVGGYVTGDKTMIDYLRNFAKSAIYSTALPPAILASAYEAIRIIRQKNLGEKSLENARYFCQLMNLTQSESSIVIIAINDNEKVVAIAKKIAEKGFLISAIRPPTVEPGKARLRITFSASHKKSQIKKLAKALQQCL